MVFILQVLKNRKAMKSAWELVKLIRTTTSDGELTSTERNSLNKAFWELANEIRKSQMYDYKIKRGSVYVVDGDTIKCVLDLGFSILHKATIRLAGINCPETRTRNLAEKELGKKAKSRLKELIKGQDIELHCEKEKGKFGRVIGTLWVNDTIGAAYTRKRNINKQMVTEGHAREYTGGKRLPWVVQGYE